jgi:uncharacterized protein (DUF427 family)
MEMKTTGTINRAGRVRVEQARKRVRAYLAGEVVADTTQPSLVWEVPYYPTYYFPVADVRTDLLVPTATVTHSPSRGNAQHFTVKAGDLAAEDAALRYVDSPDRGAPRPHPARLGRMDGWFEEDEEVYTHPRDPYTRVDILATSRPVRVELDGVVLAESPNACVLFETGLPPRWYIPKTDVRMSLLMPTGNVTHCPTRAKPSTGRSAWATAWSRTLPGPTARRCPRARRSPAWWPSTPSGSTCSSTTSSSSGRSPSSASDGLTKMSSPTPAMPIAARTARQLDGRQGGST